MFRRAENNVIIEGILAENGLEKTSYTKNGQAVECIRGKVTVLVEQTINGENANMTVPVSFFANRYKKGSNEESKLYTSLLEAMNDLKSIAATGSKATADRVRITGANIGMNEFPSRATGKIVSTPQIEGKFINKALGTFNPQATFTVEGVVGGIIDEVDGDGVETGALTINFIVPQYTPENAAAMKVDVVPLKAVSPTVVAGVKNAWEKGNTYIAAGRIRFIEEVVAKQVDLAFGEVSSIPDSRSTMILEVTGSSAARDGDMAYTIDEIRAGIAARNARHEEMKKNPPVKATPVKNSTDLGF